MLIFVIFYLCKINFLFLSIKNILTNYVLIVNHFFFYLLTTLDSNFNYKIIWFNMFNVYIF